jgi:hypothetical protein
MNKIKAKVIADSINSYSKNRLTTLEVEFPRFILAELNTHRQLTKNSASLRAIPVSKMIKMVKENPFIPIAWQKHHSGMQGTEYLSKTDKYNLISFIDILNDTLKSFVSKDSKEYKKLEEEINEKLEIINTYLQDYKDYTFTLDEWWLVARDKAVEMASLLYVFRVTKQLCNRLLEPFMWHTVLITATEFSNFWQLRCSQYSFGENTNNPKIWRSKKDAIKEFSDWSNRNDLFWLSINKGQAEIHIMALAEAIYDAINESTPKELQHGEYHLPFGDNIDRELLYSLFEDDDYLTKYSQFGWEYFDIDETIIKIAIARCARLSYKTLGDDKEHTYKEDIALYDKLSQSGHWSPFEHIARCMSKDEYYSYYKGEDLVYYNKYERNKLVGVTIDSFRPLNNKSFGWCNNFRGFIQQRYILESK